MLSFNKLDKWDKKYILKYNGYGGKFFTNLLRSISFLGRETLWLSLIVYFLFIWYDRLLFSAIASTFLIGVIIIVPMKSLIERDRPFEELKEVNILDRKPTSSSFPSWHAYNVISQGLILIFIINSIWFTFLVIILATLVCFSRVQLGVHYPSDVIFGGIIGVIGFLCSFFLLTPFTLQILKFFEHTMTLEIYYQTLNVLLYENMLYLLLVIGLFIIIFLLAISDRIKRLYKRFK